MIRLILHQIWNQRRQNFWIWLELTLLSVFMWLALDPLFTMTCVTQVPRGYELDGLYTLNPVYDFRRPYFTDKNFTPQMDHLLTRLSEHPMVEQVCLSDRSHFLSKPALMLVSYYRSHDEAQSEKDKEQREKGVYAQRLTIPVREGLEKWTDLPGTLRVRDAATGQILHARTDATLQDMVYISANMAREIYGTERAQDSILCYLEDKLNVQGWTTEEHSARVGAVCADIKMVDYQTAPPFVFHPEEAFRDTSWPLIRVKEGVDEDEFREAIQRDVLSQCTIDDVTEIEVQSVKKDVRRFTERSGAYNIIRLRSAMGFFGLLCAFLGVSGLFWVRCNDRRQDMGILRSMGASRGDVRRQMLAEAALLLTLAFLPAMLYIGWHVHANGYDVGLAESSMAGKADMAYWFNRPVPHVLSVTALTFLAMLLTTLLATWLPVHRATRTLPCDALRDE